MVKKEKLPSGGYTTELEHPEEINEEINSLNLNLVMKDGKRYSLLTNNNIVSSGWMSFLSDGPGEMTIYSTAFSEPMDLELIDGIELDGVFYPIDDNEQQ